MNKTLVFDMDGTIANLYEVVNWLEDLRSFNPRPYIMAEPMYDMDILNAILNELKNNGWKIVVTSWLSKESTRAYDKEVRKAYDKEVRKAKVEWLERYNFPFDEIHIVKYGTTKANCTRKLGGLQYLFDDNEQVRNGWDNQKNRFSFDANQDIIITLTKILLDEI